MVETPEALSAFADRLYVKSTVLASTDKIVEFNPWTGEAIGRGQIQYPATLGSHFRAFQMK